MAEAAFIRSALFARFGIIALFTERHAGISPPPFDSLNFDSGSGDSHACVQHNLQQLCDAAAIPAPHTARQVHGATPLWCSGAGAGHRDTADILLTEQAGCAVGVRTADCLPLLLADPSRRIAAAVHAGWRGTVAHAAETAVAAMLNHGAAAERIIATLGPCIGPCCFETGEDVARQLAASVAGGTHAVRHTPTPHADLAAINRLQLLAAGLRDEHIEQSACCTCCHPHRFFSYRRDRGATGRHLAVVALGSAA